MKKSIVNFTCLLVLVSGCGRKSEQKDKAEILTPSVLDNGNRIVFQHSKNTAFFETELISSSSLQSEIVAPAKVSATVIKSDESNSQNIILFENPDLAANYSQLLQHLITINQIQNVNIKQRQIELERTKDLNQHGAATGKDLLEAQTALAIEETNLSNERAANIEHETKLKAGGFQTEVLRKATPGTVYIICDIPESQVNKIVEGSKCSIQFTSFPNEKFEGKIDEIADMVDPGTRMVKLRVTLNISTNKLKAGMFASVSFGVNEGNAISANKNSLITIQAKNYVFVKTDSVTFVRKEVKTGDQVGDRIIIYSGIKDGEVVAIKGVMQLKGLSFGY